MTFGIDPAFFLTLALVIASGTGDRLPGLLFPILVHEAAHAAAVKLFGGKLSRIELLPFGLRMIPAPGLSYGQEIAAVAAGPAAHLVSAALCSLTSPGAGLAGILIALYNALPLAGLDGGRILLLTFRSREKEESGRRLTAFFSIVFAIAAGAAALIAAGRGEPFMSLLMAGAAPLFRLTDKERPLFRRRTAAHKEGSGSPGECSDARRASRLRARAKE